MFGLLISGRPINAAPSQISPTQYTFSIPSQPSFSHIALFILPGAALPPDAAATVWLQIPQASADFKLLGALSATKQSAIFKVSGVSSATAANATQGDDVMLDDAAADMTASAPTGPELILGISIEPVAAVETQLATLSARPANAASSALVRQTGPTPLGQQQTPASGNAVTTKVLAQRIIGNAFNFLASFGSETVPLKAFQGWWEKFEKKIELDPTFLERAEQG